ncbi:PDZ domain-containing protein [bacterium]|nr:PDZ domain-containing protein [bacterium]MDB4483785.1 PDZ domain-containing protein [bacterium]
MPDKFFLVRLSASSCVGDLHALLRTCISRTPQTSFCLVISAVLLLPGLAISSTEIQPKSDKPVYETGQTLANFLPSNNSKPADAITLALNELDSPIFKVREKAIQQLVKLGEPAIEALALRSLDCTPETAWRIRKILEEISIAGDEPVFLKSIAILQIRFRSGMKSAAMRESFAKLENRWKSNRKKLAIQNLRALGAIVVDPLEDIDEDMAQIAGFQNEIFLLNPPGIAPRFPEVDQAGNPSTNQTTNREYRKLPSKAELREQITKIVNADIATNRELVFKKTKTSPNPESLKPSDRRQAEQNGNRDDMKLEMLLIQQRNNRLNRNLLGQPFGSPSIGLDITFGTQWMGKTGDFSTLDDIGKIDNIAFIERNVSNDLLSKLAEITSMSKLSFERCTIDINNIANKQWGNLTSLELKNTAVESGLIQAFASIKSLISLEFVNCTIAEGTLQSIGNYENIRSLMFKDTEVDATALKSIEPLTNIKYLNLSACKFSTESYRRLKKSRPDINIDFSGQAFFGVRGSPVGMGRPLIIRPNGNIEPPNHSQTGGALISEVVAQSGAAKAGIETGDIIEFINGETIVQFEDLRLQIAQYRAGEKLNVGIIRNGEAMEVEVELGDANTAPENQP